MQGFPFDFPSISFCQLYSNEFYQFRPRKRMHDEIAPDAFSPCIFC